MGEFAKKLGVAVRAALLDSPELLRQPDRLKEIARKAVVESTTMFDRTALQQLVEAKDPNPWVQDLYGKDAIPFSDLPDGAEFRMPKSDSIKVKLKGNRYTDKGGSKTFKTGMGSAVIPVKATDESLDEKSPPGWKGTVKAMKKHMPDDKAFALAWSMKKKGMKPHYKMGKDGEPVKKDEDFRSAVAELRGLIGEGRSPLQNLAGRVAADPLAPPPPTQEQIKVSLRAIKKLESMGLSPRSYSGRGMWGAECVGVSVSSDDAKPLRRLFGGSAIDALGMGAIVYWPRLPWPPGRRDSDVDFSYWPRLP